MCFASYRFRTVHEKAELSYLKLIHVTLVAHALHRVCETIRVLYPNVDKLVVMGRKSL
jgi:hypothetical protein